MTRSLRWPIVIALLLTLLPTVASAQAQGELPAWGTVPSPNGGFGPNELASVSALSATDAWAVGNFEQNTVIRPLVQHWDGVAWSIVPTPSVSESELLGVAAVGPDDVWMVGGYENTGDALIMHWDGTAISVVPHPNPGTFNRLYSVEAVSANDVWAVGEFTSPISDTLTLHWDGSTWTHVPSPNGTHGYNTLYGVSAIATDDVWAVGEDGTFTLTIHWDGLTWSRVPSPTPGSFAGLRAVSGSSTRSVWAVGDAGSDSLTMRWNGRRWRVVPSPNPGNNFLDLNGVFAVAPNDAWAVGFFDVFGQWKTLAMHWDGSAWSVVDSPSPDPTINVLNGVSAVSGSDVWAVGDGGGTGTLALRWDGQAWVDVPSANAGIGSNVLTAISVSSADDIWAVGNAQFRSLTLHYDGTQWSIVPSPDLEFGIQLEDVVAIAPNDAWAVGWSGSGGGLEYVSVAMHWDGVEWSIVETPQPGGDSIDQLFSIDAVAPDDVWAAGLYWGPQGEHRSVILHWDGTDWSRVSSQCDAFGGLTGLTALSSTDVWAVGNATTCHYDGSAWTRVASPQPRIEFNEIGYPLHDVSAVSSTNVWAVGARVIDNPKFVTFVSFAERWNGRRWSRVIDIPGQVLYGVEAIAANDVWAVGTSGFGPLIAHFDGSTWTSVPTPEAGSGGQLGGVDSAAPDDLWSAGQFHPGDTGSRTLILQAPSKTQGAVVGDTNVAGAVVSWFGPEEGSTGTDSFGRYEVAGLLAGDYTFIASSAGCSPDLAEVTVVAGVTIVQDFRLDC